MKRFRSVRWLLLALLLPLIPASQAHAGVFISVGFAPPILPVYVQPACPEPGYMWTPGYWGYGPDGYYWVPGAWVPAPYEGALWTPPYWGWQGGLYIFHPGYWGPHVGYYGGVNYGFGFFGVGFVGGRWHGGVFAYNTAVVHVGVGPRWGGNRVYVDRTVIENHTVVRDSRVAYSGGPGGIRHEPTTEERTYMHEQHMDATAAQQAHMQAARADRGSYFNSNHGQPQHAAMERPMGFNGRANAGVQGRQGGFNGSAGARSGYRQQQPNGYRGNGQQGYRGQGQPRPQYQPRPQSRPESRPQGHPEARPQGRPESRPQHDSGPHGHGR
jgi:hypothetical protein